MSEYNGWKNHATWNVALWLRKDDDMNYQVERFNRCEPLYGSTYAEFITHFAALGDKTPDGVHWLDDTLDYAALNRVVWEVGSSETFDTWVVLAELRQIECHPEYLED